MTVSITSSWDDGHVLDLRVADMLDRYGLTGTFYIARDFLDERMSDSQLQDLAQRHEVGAHTLTHPVLTEISLEQARDEIHGSKIWLEDVLGQEVTSFCYPKGANNLALQQIVADAGYVMARTVDKFTFSVGDNPYCVPTTLQIYPYPLRPLPRIAFWRGWRSRLQPLLDALPTLRTFRLGAKTLFNWQVFAESLLQTAAQENGIWHLWGHSWEIERYDLWDALDNILQTVAAYDNSQSVTNSGLITHS
ncbi:MAG: polysaccharide deacetylase family protein [Anaerolineae bacterium]|nr:polysaccharide deacetylase family protein [Anaerolineae bacterium]